MVVALGPTSQVLAAHATGEPPPSFLHLTRDTFSLEHIPLQPYMINAAAMARSTKRRWSSSFPTGTRPAESLDKFDLLLMPWWRSCSLLCHTEYWPTPNAEVLITQESYHDDDSPRTRVKKRRAKLHRVV